MPELAAGGPCDAGQLIMSATEYVSEALALICSRAPATEVALTAVVLRDLLAEMGRLGMAGAILRDHGDERYADGVEAGIEIGRARVLAEQAADAEDCRGQLRVIRPQRDTGPFPALPRTAGGA